MKHIDELIENLPQSTLSEDEKVSSHPLSLIAVAQRFLVGEKKNFFLNSFSCSSFQMEKMKGLQEERAICISEMEDTVKKAEGLLFHVRAALKEISSDAVRDAD